MAHLYDLCSGDKKKQKEARKFFGLFVRAMSSDTEIESEQDRKNTLAEAGIKPYQGNASFVPRVETPTVSQQQRTEPTRDDDEREIE